MVTRANYKNDRTIYRYIHKSQRKLVHANYRHEDDKYLLTSVDLNKINDYFLLVSLCNPGVMNTFVTVW